MKLLADILGVLLGACVVMLIIFCFITPHKTKNGTFTDPYKYWTDDAYFCENFNCPKELKGVTQ